MKKYFLYILALATSMMACTDDYTDWADPQHNDEETAQSVSFTAANASAINFADVEEGSYVKLFTPSVQAEEGATVTYKVTFPDGTVLDATEDGEVYGEDLSAVIVSIYGKRPVERDIEVTVTAIVSVNGQAVKRTAPVTVLATLTAPVIDSAYYLVGDMCGWSADTMVKFSHSDSDVYDDPEFTVVFTASADNQYWKVIPQTNVDNDNIWGGDVLGVGTDGDTALSGMLILGSNPGAGKIEKAGTYRMTLNMMDYTYTIEQLVPEYFLVGALQGWNASSSGMTCMMYPQSVTVHSYTTSFTGDHNLKIWSSSDFGNWDKAYGTPVDGDSSISGTIGGSGAICSPEAGVYYTITVDFGANTYSWTKLANQSPTSYTKIGLIGDFNSWGGDEELTEVTPHNWMISEFTVASSGGIKFRANGGWDINWGSDVNLADTNYGTGVGNGANITIVPGTYDVYFNDITGEFVFRTR